MATRSFMRRSEASPNLTAREWEILRLMAAGRRNGQIAQELNVTVRTVKFHIGNIYAKLGTTSRYEAILWAWKDSPPGAKD